jgi:hypothetical protein
MRQPDLEEEEALRIQVRGRDLTVERQTMSDSVEDVTLTSPTGKSRTLTLTQGEPGLWRSTIEANELGLWRAADSKLTALAKVGPANPREFAEVTSRRLRGPLRVANGRPYLSDAQHRPRAGQWTQIDWGPSHGPNGGVADTLDEAKATFRRAWDAQQ